MSKDFKREEDGKNSTPDQAKGRLGSYIRDRLAGVERSPEVLCPAHPPARSYVAERLAKLRLEDPERKLPSEKLSPPDTNDITGSLREARTVVTPRRKSRAQTLSIAGHYPTEQVQAFRVLAAQENKDVQQLLAEGINLIFKRHGLPVRVPVTSRRRKRGPGNHRTL